MAGSLRIYGKLLAASVRSQAQYRASFLMTGFGQLMISGVEFVAILALFDRFGRLKDWSLPEVALLYGMANLSFAIAEWFGRGFDTFAGLVKSGDFDRVLLRPRTTVLQIAGRELALRRFGRALQGGAILGWAAASCGVAWSLANAGLLIAAIVGGACLFCGIFVLHATICFWTIESVEITNIISHGGVESAQYPMDIYDPWFRRFFTFIIPLMFLNYYPGLMLMRPGALVGLQAIVGWAAPLVGAGFLGMTLFVWRFGVRHYQSTGS